jgi:hypothetical protein
VRIQTIKEESWNNQKFASDFFRQILETETSRRDITSIIVPDIEPEILEKVSVQTLKREVKQCKSPQIVEYIYMGTVSIDPKWMSDFIEACNLLQLKATISCERKLVFDSKPLPSATFSFKSQPVSSTPIQVQSKKSNLDSLIAELEHEEQENVEYMKQEGDEMGGQILEVYEIS